MWFLNRKSFFTVNLRHPYNKIGDGPEGPECRIICQYLNKNWKGKTIIKIHWDEKSKFNKHKIKGLDLLIYPCKINGVYSRGKLIIIDCTNKNNKNIFMISQLGMTGKWIHSKDKYSRLTVDLCALDKKDDQWYFSDARCFGNFNIYNDMTPVFKKHGPCLLLASLVSNNNIKQNQLKTYQKLATLKIFQDKIRNKRIKNKQICIFLLEQKHCSSIGNIYRSEALYRAKINPKKLLSELSDEDIINLYNCIIKQLYISYNSMNHGNYQTSNVFQVYNKKTDPLGNVVETFKDKTKRTVHWVSTVQN